MKFEETVLGALKFFGPMSTREILEKVLEQKAVNGAQEGPRLKHQIRMAVVRLKEKGQIVEAQVIKPSNERIYRLEYP